MAARVFISYSRQDADLVQRLDALKSHVDAARSREAARVGQRPIETVTRRPRPLRQFDTSAPARIEWREARAWAEMER